MVDFRTKLITLVGMTVAVAGMAFGQTTVNPIPSPVTANTDFIRAEGVTELVGSSTISLSAGAAASTVNLQVFVGTGTNTVTPLGITSKASEALASGAFVGSPIAGVISGTSVTFSNIPLTAGQGIVPITITNIRVNSAGVATSANAPPIPVSVQYYLTGTNVTPAVTAPVAVAFVQNGLGAITSSNIVTTNTTCAAVTAAGTPTQYNVKVTEGFASSFKTLAEENSNGTNASTAATSGTRLMLAFANVPNGVAVYVPLTVLSTTLNNLGVLPATQTTLGLVNNATGAPVAATAASTAAPTNAPAASGAVTITNNTGTAIYNTTFDSTTPLTDVFAIPVTYVSAAGAVVPSTAATVTVSFAPSISPTATATDFPSFNNTIATTTVNGSTYASCSTTLLFPYVLNPTGWETGLAISNTSLDNLKVGGGNSLGASQAGTCVLSFFGSPTGNNPANFTTPSVVAGTTWANTLTATAGAGFAGGYAIANCSFQYAHGFAYIVNSFGTTSQMAMGYTAKVLGRIATPETLGE
jgi:hypothetical protein